ncbi:MAG: hypothetical protein E7444_05015 [Ruminococcaceae bacterium]|nr:hypothetical protein [Oscillospiraceae bacterium]
MVKVSTDAVQPFEQAHYAALRALAPECAVLLKKNGDFPLNAPCAVALYGAGARETIKGGTGSGNVNVRHYTTVEEGLENAGFTVTTKEWLRGCAALRAEIAAKFEAELVAEAKATGRSYFMVSMGRVPPAPHYAAPIDGAGDVGIYILSRDSGEGADRHAAAGDLLLTEDEKRDILACAEKYKKFMLVLNVGGPVDISAVLPHVENVLLLSQLGSVTGDVFADLLLGKAYPSGKLATTWAKAEDYPSLGDFGLHGDARYREGVFVGYRYYDAAGVEPIFPFGFGLGYTDFETSVTGFAVEDKTAAVTVTVRNTGAYAGRETLQLYYSAPAGKLPKPLRELGAYQKTAELLPGEQASYTLTLPLEDMASWDGAEDAWLLEAGDYVLSVNGIPAGIASLTQSVYTSRLSHACGDADFADWQGEKQRSVPENLPRLAVDAAMLEGAGHFDRARIAGEKLNLPELSDFTVRELATVCAGKYRAGGELSVIGNASARVSGAAGETADIAEEKGFGKLVMADGPAGVRVNKRYFEVESGAINLDLNSSIWFKDLMSPEEWEALQAQQLENERRAQERGEILYHYAAAIPIGTALAQSWNAALQEECGDIVAEEMQRFGVNLWLAPAMNIHRSPLCGRNFEYYSEDPLISGKTAAAIVRGIQKREKCAATIKHFACNNQETDRFGSNTILSQRALREIYLKGFEICVKESAPMSVMTSYNLINGVHSANNQALLETILRGEWGFEGVVMTDWGTTGSAFNRSMGMAGCSDPMLCVRAGNDLIMPGQQDDVDRIVECVESGELSIEELRICAGRILALCKRLRLV